MRKIFTDPVSRLQLITVLFFAVVYSLLSLVNHYNFRTYAYDLGLHSSAMWDYAHFRFNNCTLLQPELKNYLSEHFEVFTMVLSPFSYIFGTYTLLVFQILSVLFGGFGVYKFIEAVSADRQLGFMAQLHFYFFYGIFSALQFDYHDNVLGAMFVPWFFYFIHIRSWRWAIVFFIFQISTKENMPLWMAFVCLGLLLLYWNEKKMRWMLLYFSIAAFVYFILVVKYIMPALANEGEAYVQIRNNYSALGSSLSEIVVTMATRPLYVIELLFTGHSGSVHGDYYKAESYIFVLLSGGILFLARPQFMVMLIPVFAQKMFHNDFLKWGLGDHYSIEFAPICSLGAFYVVSKVRHEKWKKYISTAVVVLCVAASFRSMDNTYSYFDRTRQRIYQKEHYVRSYDIAEVYDAFRLIPDDAKVSAQSPFVPHLVFRDYIYQFPVVLDAEYVVLSFAETCYPLTKQQFDAAVLSLMDSEEWETICKKNNVIVLKRKAISKG